MLKTRHREKLINAALYFAAHTRHCGKIKLIKLLYLLDFEHYRQTGASVTGLEYRAMKMGPVPLDLYQEWDALEPDFAAAIDIVPERVLDYVRESVHPKRPFDDSHFSKRELRLMAALAERFCEDYSQPMINITHAERGPGRRSGTTVTAIWSAFPTRWRSAPTIRMPRWSATPQPSGKPSAWHMRAKPWLHWSARSIATPASMWTCRPGR